MVILSNRVKLRKGYLATGCIPDPLRSYEDLQKYHHRDLPDLDDLALWREESKTKRALVYCNPDQLYVDYLGELQTVQGWLIERIGKIRKERKRRAAG